MPLKTSGDGLTGLEGNYKRFRMATNGKVHRQGQVGERTRTLKEFDLAGGVYMVTGESFDGNAGRVC